MATEQELSYLVKVNDRDLRELRKRVTDTNKALGQGTAKSSSRAGRAIGGMASFARGGAVALAGMGIEAKRMIGAASNLNEQQNKASVVFGKSAGDIKAWASTTASSIGISNRAALEAAGTFGNMLVPMGFARTKAADMSKGLVNLSADLASFNNADPSETLEAIRSGLAGETEPLRRFGIFLNQARIQQEAQRLGLVKGNETLTAAQKAQATYSIILKDSKDAQGDFARTSNSAANEQRTMTAETEDLEAAMGQGLLPVWQRFLGIATRGIGIAKRHTTTTKVAAGVVGLLAASFVAAKVAMAVADSSLLRLIKSERVAKIATRAFAIAQGVLNAVLTANPIGLVIVGLVALGAAFVIAYKKSSTFRHIVSTALAAVKVYVAPAKFALEALVGIIQKLVSWISTAADKLSGLGDIASGIGDKIGSLTSHIPFAAHGGFSTGGTRIVGERGYEVITDAGFVHPHGVSRRMAAGGGPLVHVENLIVRDRLDAELVAGSLARKLALR